MSTCPKHGLTDHGFCYAVAFGPSAGFFVCEARAKLELAHARDATLEEAARTVVSECPTTKAAGACCAGCDYAAERVRSLKSKP